MSNHDIRWASTIMLLILFSIFGSASVFGQGGTGREQSNPNSAKNPATKKQVTAKKTGSKVPEPEPAYTPSGATAEAFRFIIDIMNAYGSIPLSEQEIATGFQGQFRYRFVPLGECTAKIIWEHNTDSYFSQDISTFSFADLDPSQLAGWRVQKITTKNGVYYYSPMYLSTPNYRLAIKGHITSSYGEQEKPDSFLIGFKIGDNESGETQQRMLKALKSAIEVCGGKPSPF